MTYKFASKKEAFTSCIFSNIFRLAAVLILNMAHTEISLQKWLFTVRKQTSEFSWVLNEIELLS